jgi:hypothetical protein
MEQGCSTKRQGEMAMKRLCRGMNVTDYAWLCRYDTLLTNIYAITTDLVTVVPDRELSMPWAVVLLLGAHSAKHIFIGNKGPDRRNLNEALKNFTNRMKWTWRYRNTDKDENFRKLLKRDVRPYDNLASPEVEKCCLSFTNTMRAHFTAVSRKVARQQRCSNKPVYVKAALNWLRAQNLQAWRSDKDGVFVIAAESTINTLVMNKISESTSTYIRVGAEKPDEEYRLSLGGVTAACDLLYKLGFKAWARECSEAYKSRGAVGLVSRVTITIKTHKPRVSCRLIHSAVGSSLAGLSCVLHRWFSQALEPIRHMCKDTRDLLAKLAEIRLPPNCFFTKWDIKDFYLSGAHGVLVQAVLPRLDINLREFSELALWLLLNNQFVQWGTHYYRIDRGSGMGLTFSGTLADLAFDSLVESKINQEQLGILAYFRFRDDIVCITTSKEAAEKAFEFVQRAAQPHWILECDSMSDYGVAMLDAFIYKGPTFKGGPVHELRTLDFAPFVKKTARHVPLSPLSAHPRSIHESWPVSEIRRVRRLSMHLHSFHFYRKLKVQRFKLFFLNPDVVHRCEVWKRRLVYNTAVKPTSEGAVLRFVVKWHPSLAGLNSVIAKFFDEWRGSLGPPGSKMANLTVQVAYGLAGKPLYLLCRGKPRN